MSDPYNRDNPPGQQAGSGPNADPLAELARLIGQTDPFAEFGKDSQRASADRAAATIAQQPPRHTEPNYGAAPQAYQQPAYQQPAYQQPAYQQPAPQSYADPRRAPAPSYAPAAPPQQSHQQSHQQSWAPQPPQAYPDHQDYGAQSYAPAPAYEQQGHPAQSYPPQTHQQPPAYREPHFAGGGDAYQPPYDGRGYATAAPDAHGYQPDPYYREEQHEAQHQDEIYDDAPRPRRRGKLLVVVAVLCLAVVGTAGAFAYRSFFSTGRVGGTPPVIKADTAPAKIVPAVQASDAQTNKLIYDRIGNNTAQNERVVPREEQPVEMRDQRPPARNAFPPIVGSADASQNLASANPQTSPNVGSANEPKRVRTVIIRPDQPDVVTRGTDPAQTNSSPRAAPPRTSAPPVQQAQPRQQPQQQVANAPLSLSPQGEQQAPQAPVARPPVASAPAASGGYLVQVSSQRSESEAQSSFRGLQAKYPAQLGSRNAIIRRADLGEKGTYYRSMVGPFASADEAGQFCSGLKAAGGSCVIQRN